MKGISAGKIKGSVSIKCEQQKAALNWFRSNYLYSRLTHIFLFSICLEVIIYTEVLTHIFLFSLAGV